MSVQTTYAQSIEPALAGVLANTSYQKDVNSFAAEGGAIDFGLAVSRGTNPADQVTAGGTDFVGISLRSLHNESDANTGIAAYAETETVPVLRSGYVWVECVAGCNVGDAGSYTAASGAITVGGTAIPNATFETAAPAGGLAILRIGV